MLPIEYRLKKRKQFNYIYKTGTRVGGSYIDVIYCGGGKAKLPKIGFSASKKVGNSVIRHRAVRLMREAVRPFLNKIKQNNNYIFIAKEGITRQHLLFITLDVETILKKVNLL
jgi:ribonuclease P protein component